MGRKTHPPPHRASQHHKGKARTQGAHKKQRSEGINRALRDLEDRGWWRREGEAA